MRNFWWILEVFNKGNPRQIGARIKRLFTRVGLDEMEVNFLRGFLGAVEKKLKNSNSLLK